MFNYKLYLVTDESACKGRNWLQVVEEAVKGGVDLVQIREKELPEKEFLYKTLKLKERLELYKVPLIVNDNLKVAMAGEAAGIHVGNKDTAPVDVKQQWAACSILGYSLEFEEQLATENAVVADYLALSPVFATPTKRDTLVEWGLKGIQQIRALTRKPLVAIGNVTAANAKDLIEAGADCLAVVTAICSAPHPAKAAEQLRNEIEKTLNR